MHHGAHGALVGVLDQVASSEATLRQPVARSQAMHAACQRCVDSGRPYTGLRSFQTSFLVRRAAAGGMVYSIESSGRSSDCRNAWEKSHLRVGLLSWVARRARTAEAAGVEA